MESFQCASPKSRSGMPLRFGRINLHSQAVKGILGSTLIFDTESHLSFRI